MYNYTSQQQHIYSYKLALTNVTHTCLTLPLGNTACNISHSNSLFTITLLSMRQTQWCTGVSCLFYFRYVAHRSHIPHRGYIFSHKCERKQISIISPQMHNICRFNRFKNKKDLLFQSCINDSTFQCNEESTFSENSFNCLQCLT